MLLSEHLARLANLKRLIGQRNSNEARRLGSRAIRLAMHSTVLNNTVL